MRIFMKKGVRTDMERHYMWAPYNRAVEEAQQHLDVDGVKEYLVQASNKADDYGTKMTSFLESERLVESEKYKTDVVSF